MIGVAIANQINRLEPMVKGARANIRTQAGADRRPGDLELIGFWLSKIDGVQI